MDFSAHLTILIRLMFDVLAVVFLFLDIMIISRGSWGAMDICTGVQICYTRQSAHSVPLNSGSRQLATTATCDTSLTALVARLEENESRISHPHLRMVAVVMARRGGPKHQGPRMRLRRLACMRHHQSVSSLEAGSGSLWMAHFLPDRLLATPLESRQLTSLSSKRLSSK